jgi:NAD(P)-dependent dehydrogenase (short-subunit alcohol dehydrogenase family)
MSGIEPAMQDAVLITAIYLAEQGFQVYATMRNLGSRGRLDAEAARRNVRLEVLQLDVTDETGIQAAVDTIIARSGGIYGLINNAGTQVRGYFEDLSDAEIRRVFDTNVFGTMAVTRAVLPHMRKARRGRIMIVGSVGGQVGSLALSAYCASKFALEGFGESLALEMALLGVQVILVEPAIINTEIWGQNRHIAERALDPSSPYYAWFRESERLADWLVDSSPAKSEDVARVVHQALTAQPPRLRYMVGRRASLLLTLRRYLPDQLFETLYFGEAVRRVTGVKRP